MSIIRQPMLQISTTMPILIYSHCE